MSRRALSVVMAERWDKDYPLSGCSRGSVATLWQTLMRSEAVRSRSSLCLIVGKPPFGQIIAWFAEKAEPQLHLVGVDGSGQP